MSPCLVFPVDRGVFLAVEYRKEEDGIDNLLNNGKDTELLLVLSSPCCYRDRLSSSKSTAVNSCRGLIFVLWVLVEEAIREGGDDNRGR